MNDIDQLFTGELRVEVPPLESELMRKMPGDRDGDNKGDECAV